MRRFPKLCAALACFLIVPPAIGRAGGPCKFGAQCPIVWDTTCPINYAISPGDLGSISAAEIQAAIKSAFHTWGSVPTASIRFQFAGLQPKRIESLAAYMHATHNETGGNVVVLDERGDIVAERYGADNRDQIWGFARPVVSGNKIAAFYSLLNGAMADSVKTFRPTLVHEFGHAAGLDHTQINADLAETIDRRGYPLIPVMFPTSTDDLTQGAELKPDDIAWISMLYQSPLFLKNYGWIRGRVVRGRQPVLGANVIATNIVNGAAIPLNRFSCVSDWLKQLDGTFVIPVPPGNYRLHLEPIRVGFTGYSSVGPHADKKNSPSFVSPIAPLDLPTMWPVMAGQTTNVGDVRVK